MLAWFEKLPPILAFDGGIARIVKQYLLNTGKYEEFYQIVEKHRKDVFGYGPLKAANYSIFLPTRTLDEEGDRFSMCSMKNYTDRGVKRVTGERYILKYVVKIF
jgi:hypothetical protein